MAESFRRSLAFADCDRSPHSLLKIKLGHVIKSYLVVASKENGLTSTISEGRTYSNTGLPNVVIMKSPVTLQFFQVLQFKLC